MIPGEAGLSEGEGGGDMRDGQVGRTVGGRQGGRQIEMHGGMHGGEGGALEMSDNQLVIQ